MSRRGPAAPAALSRALVMVGGVALLAGLGAACAFATWRPMPPQRWHRTESPLDRFFRRVVVEGRVHYGDLAYSDGETLDSLIAGLAAHDTTGWDLPMRMALHVDLYNLVMIRAVADRWKPGWTPASDGFAVFKAPLVPTRDGPISLDELEKRRTLAVYQDPRLHVAFNCAARSCPPLASRSRLTGPGISMGRALDDEMRRFIAADPERNQVDHARRVLRLSRIFDWYAADFGGRAGVLKTVGRYLGRDVSGYRVEFLEYDWSLNAIEFPDGSRPPARPRAR